MKYALPSTFVLLASAVLAPSVAASQEPSFWEHWGDGQAELSGYSLSQPRYGQMRKGTVVLIFVTEPFSESARVKADPGKHPDSDVFQVLKLNTVKDFQTGIYDYNLMTSAFAALSPRAGHPAGDLAKLVFSSQEWCGALFEELLFDKDQIRQRRFSYFDGEGDQDTKLDYPKGGVTVDGMPIRVRGLAAAPPSAGATTKLKVLPSLERMRLVHKPLVWLDGELSRSKSREKVSVPFGSFSADHYVLKLSNGDTYEYWVDQAYPRRLLRWTGPDGEDAKLLKSTRLPYWKLHNEGDEKLLSKLGIRQES